MCFYRLPFDFYLPKTHFVMFWVLTLFELINSDFWFLFFEKLVEMMISSENFCKDSFQSALAKETKAALRHLESLKFGEFLQKMRKWPLFFKNRVLKTRWKFSCTIVRIIEWCFMKDIPLACWSFMTSQDKNWLNPIPNTSKVKTRWMTLWRFYLLKQTWTSSAKQEGNKRHKLPPPGLWHA